MAGTRKGEGQTALVTGASSGIGVDLAQCFAQDGYDLILVARSEAALKDVADTLARTYHIKATPIAADLAKEGAGRKLADDIRARNLSVNVLVNNAGYGIAGAFAFSEEAPQLGMIDLNVRALAELTHIYWPSMIASKRGGVLNVASTAAFQPGPLMAVYYASKAYVLSFSEALAEELRNTGVTVTALCPGPTKTEFAAAADIENTRLFNSVVADAKSVAEFGYEATMEGKRVAIPGMMNKIVAQSNRIAPRILATKLVRMLQERR